MPIYIGSDVSSDRTIACDVCIVGSGAGGAVLAERLSAKGKKVVLLEDGGFHTSDKFTLTEKVMMPRLYQELAGRATSDQSMAIAQGRAVGGTTVVNWTTCFRTPKRVMDHWKEHHGVEGLTHEALGPHWDRIEERINVVKMRLEQVNRNNMITWRGLERLGWHKDLLSRNVKNCAHSGYCGVGCAIDAKQSMLVTMIPDAVKAGTDVYANAWVERVIRDGRKITGVVARIRDPKTDKRNGTTLTVNAKVTVLSAGAINTPAILLRSQIDGNGRAGYRTFLHPAIGVVGVHEEIVEPFVGSPQYVYSDQFVDRPGKMTFLIEGAPMFPMASGGFVGALGAERQAQMGLMKHASLTGVLLHDGFELGNRDDGARVSLKPNGHPKIDYPWTDRLREGLRAAIRASMEIQLAGGAKQVWGGSNRYARSAGELDRVLAEGSYEPASIPIFVAHCMGGCPMGTDPKTSVVDSRTLRHHELDNLFVVDGSVYPTSLTVNPQISIYGLASWAAQHVEGAVS
jgi:choline dehydrogenase-like flavoprotein